MGGVLQNILSIIVIVEYIIGNFVNGFIAVVNFVDWIKRKKISSANQIITSLAISRIVFLWLQFLNWWLHEFYPDLLMTKDMVEMIYIAWSVTSHFNMWLSACLSIFYFLKIANFSNATFLYLKWRVTKVISVTLLVSLVLLLLNILLMKIYGNERISEYKTNMSCSSSSSDSTGFTRIVFFMQIGLALIPFTVSLTTFILLIFSLWKHLKRMGHNVRGSRDASTKAHIKALQTMIASLLLYTTFYLFFIIYIINSGFLKRNLIVSFLLVSILMGCPLGHSFVLILGNNDLKQASVLVLMWLRCWSKGVDSLDP
ncbi:PREDICTED: taste receptor type 2 member 14-like [Chinchilla lanigera]|uniref:taste receptor type 2 member 14-like n=1 Tax=Chinchilla lanigera TaxID=34839 RepID=UPI000698E471|nr:PREDICTED: taste receptor type 2 member 14-like [Chinchilla lanigera]